MPANMNVDRNLLFAVIALQDDLIDQTQFADVCAGWAVRLERPLADLLIERGWISEQDRGDVERKLERKLKKNQGDARATLGAVAEIDARELLQEIKTPIVRQSINGLAPVRGHVLVETLVPRANQRESLRYTLTRLHAEGGLGKIWIAHDTDLNRDVALKEIKSSTVPNPESWRRFLKEAQITGQLEHPNIVPVYELARRKEDDQPFYTMRFLRGQSLRDAIAEFHRRRAAKPANRLELQRQLLEPFVKVCQAVGYAHARGVIHRDLKPENVVLGGHGEVVVLDWGLAKVVGQPDEDERSAPEPRISVSAEAETKQTIGQVGTPVYMAPEQVEADNDSIDTRTDVYGLGAILFEILTAHPPASGATIGEVFSKIQAGNLPRAREIEPTVPRALEAVCSKALERDRSKRYRRSEDLAEEIRRWIVDEPVTVYRDPFAVRMLRWSRRHRTLATTLAALIMTTVVGLSVGVALIERERGRTEKQRNIADQQRRIATANAGRALHNLRLAQDATDGLLAEVADVDLADIPQMEPVRQRLLEKAQAGYQQFLVQEGDDPLIRWGAARSQVRLGDVQALLGDVPKAEATYRQAAAELEGLSTDDPANANFRRDLARALEGLGALLKDANRFQEAESRLRHAIRLREEISKLPDSTALDRQALADGRYQLGAVLARRGAAGPDDAIAYRSALEAQEALVKQYGDRPEYRTRLARYRNNLAILQNVLGNPRESETTLRATLELLAPSVQIQEPLPAPRWQFARASNNLGSLLLKGRTDEAQNHLRRAQRLLSKLAAEFPVVTQYPLELASVDYNLGLLAAITGHSAEAIGSYQDSARLLETLKSRFPAIPAYRIKLAVSNVALGEALAGTTPAEAEGSLNKALQEQSALLAEYPGVPEYLRMVGRSHYQLGSLLLRSKPAEAVLEAEKAKELHKEVLRTSPDSERDQHFLFEDQALLIRAMIAAGRIADAMNAAEQLPTIQPNDPALCVHAAEFLIRCADAMPATTEGRKQAEGSLARAVDLLNKAVRAKVIRLKRTLEDKALLPLHERDDFKKLLNSMDESVHIG